MSLQQFNSFEIFPLLRTFSKDELKKFEKYLVSPYFNNSLKIISLFKEIKNYHPLFSDIRLSKEALYKKISPSAAYNDSTMRNLFADLHRAALDFLSLECINRRQMDKARFLLEEMGYRGLADEFTKTMNLIESEQKKGADWNYFLNGYFFEAAKINFSYLNEKILKGRKLSGQVDYLNNSSAYLNYFYVTESISNFLNTLIYSNAFNIDLKSQWNYMLLKSIDFKAIREILKDDAKHVAILDTYLALIELFSNPENEDYYFVYRKMVEDNAALFSKDELSFHFYKLLSYTTVKISRSGSKHDFNAELFDIFKKMLAQELYKDSKAKNMPHELFRSMLMHGLKMKEYQWALNLISVYSRKVHPNDIFNMYNFGMAYLSYDMGDYGNALKYIQEIEQDYFIFKFDIKNLTLMIYYELGYNEECLYVCKTYKELLRNNRLLSITRRKRYMNFVKILEKLVLYRAGTFRYDLGYIKHGLDRNEAVAFKGWLQEKIASFGTRIGKAV